MFPLARRIASSVVALLVALCLVASSSVLAAAATPAHRAAHNAHKALTTEQLIADALLVMLNGERAAHHLKPLSMNSDLIDSAHAHNLAMARTNIMSHQETGEPGLGQRISRAGYKWTWAGENIGWNSEMTKAGVLALEKMMYDEKPPNDGHRLNILSPHFRNIGVDVYMDTVHNKVWLTEDFGRH